MVDTARNFIFHHSGLPHWPQVVAENITEVSPYLLYSPNFGTSDFDKQGWYNLFSAIDFLQENITYKIDLILIFHWNIKSPQEAWKWQHSLRYNGFN
jgi:hypothetical protein